MVVRVVCGLSATIATFCPTRALSRVDFPAFGRPRIETKPERKPSLMGNRLGFREPNLGNARFVAGEHLDTNAVPIYKVAGFGDAAEPLCYHASGSSRFQILLRTECIQQ